MSGSNCSAGCDCEDCADYELIASESELLYSRDALFYVDESPIAAKQRGMSAYLPPQTVRGLKAAYHSGLTARDVRGLGYLGDTTTTGLLASKVTGTAAGVGTGAAIGTAAGTAGGALFGAAAGSVVPVIGTVVGAVVGILTSKLFGQADYAQVYSQVANVMELARAYQESAGAYAGRAYGLTELFEVWLGLMYLGMFPLNGAAAAKGGGCTQAMITANINACGTESWVSDLVQKNAGQSIPALTNAAIKAGYQNPVTIAQQFILPNWSNNSNLCKGCVGWYNPSAIASGSEDLFEQLIVDTVDAYEYSINPNLPVYYGQLPAGFPNPGGYASGDSAVAAPAAKALSPAGTTITYGSGASLTTPQGTFTATASQWTLNGVPLSNRFSIQTISYLNGQSIGKSSTGATYQWNGASWTQLTPPTTAAAAAPTPAASAPAQPAQAAPLSPNGTTITYGSGQSLVTSAGTFTATPTQWTLNGVPLGNQLSISTITFYNGETIGAASNGATYEWNGSSWSEISVPATSSTVTSPLPGSLSPNGASMLPNTGESLTTAQGTWTFSPQGDGQGNYYALLNGTNTNNAFSELAIQNTEVIAAQVNGSTWQWNGSSWIELTAATSATVGPSLYGTPAPIASQTPYSYSEAAPSYASYAGATPSYQSYAGTGGGFDTSQSSPAPATLPTVAPAAGLSSGEKIAGGIFIALLIGGGVWAWREHEKNRA